MSPRPTVELSDFCNLGTHTKDTIHYFFELYRGALKNAISGQKPLSVETFLGYMDGSLKKAKDLGLPEASCNAMQDIYQELKSEAEPILENRGNYQR